MKAISYWALLNPKKTWVILTMIHLALGGLTTYLGILLFIKGIAVPDAVFIAGATLFMIASFLYPVRRSKYKIWKWSYVRQKTYDFSLIISGLMMLLTITNQGAVISMAKVDHSGGFAVQVAMHQQVPVASELTFWEKIQIAHIKKKVQEGFTNVVKKIQDAESGSPSKDWLIVLIGLLMAVLIGGGFMLACSLGCNFGNAGLWLVLYVGFVILVVWAGRILIKRVNASKRKMETGLGFLGI